MGSTKVSRVIPAPRRAIYRALTDPVALVEWRVPDGMTATMHGFDARTGRYRMSLTYVDPGGVPGKTTPDTDTFEGRFLELVPDEKVVEAIFFEGRDGGSGLQMSQIITLSDADGGTLVTILHENLPVGIRPEDNELGTTMALAKLQRLLS